MTTLTPRLKLVVDTLGESAIDTLSANWNRVDEAAGIMSTIKGVNIPNSKLYDGAVVVETDTGISWRCVSDGLGGYTKQYITYPFQFVAFDTINWPDGNFETGWSQYSNEGVNANAGMLDFNGPRVPVKGIYNIHLRVNFQSSAAGRRQVTLGVNSVADNSTMIRSVASPAGFGTTINLQAYRMLNANDRITGFIQTNGGAVNGNYTSIFIQMIKPVA